MKIPSTWGSDPAAGSFRLGVGRVAGGLAGWLLLFAAPAVQSASCVAFTREHVDFLSVHLQPGGEGLELLARDDDGGAVYRSDECVMVCPESMRFSLPAGTPLGDEGEPLWILPQNPYEEVPYIGVSTEALPSGSFDGPLTIRLLHVDGPGQVLVWQSTGFGSIEVRMDTRDGFGEQDRIMPQVGAHEHYNWGFTTNGLYRAYFQASGRRAGQTTNIFSEITPFTFHVLPLRPFESWTATRWPCACDTNVVAAGADPDRDEAPNAVEYGSGTDPTTFTPPPWLTVEFEARQGFTHALLSYQRAKDAPDASMHVRAAENIAAPQWRTVAQVVKVLDQGTTERVTLRDEVPVGSAGARFYRLHATIDR